MNKKLKAFTLAEVLIALAVVGFVAALTIPNLMKNSQATYYKAAFKKALTEINQSATELVAEEGKNFAQTSVSKSKIGEIQTMLAKYLSSKTVPDNHKWAITTNLTNILADDGSITANSSIQTYTPADFEYFTLPDNITLIVPNIYSCGNPHLSIISTGAYVDTPNNGCLAYIDVNGPKGPNTALMGVSSTNPAVDPCATVVIPNGNYYVKVDDHLCALTDDAVTDVFPVVFFNDKIYPATVGGYWVQNDLIGQEVAVDNTQPQVPSDKEQCENQGYTWYDEHCIKEPKLIEKIEDCKNSGNTWDYTENTCKTASHE